MMMWQLLAYKLQQLMTAKTYSSVVDNFPPQNRSTQPAIPAKFWKINPWVGFGFHQASRFFCRLLGGAHRQDKIPVAEHMYAQS